MRTAWIWAAGLASLICAAPASSQNFGQLSPATPIAVNTHLFGGYVTAGSDALGMMTQLRLSFVPNVDFGFQGGLNRVEVGSDDRTTLRLGADVKFGVMQAGAAFPVDVAVGGALGVQTGDRYTVLSLGPGAVASRGFAAGTSNVVTPYAGLFLRFSSIDAAGASNTDFDLSLRAGADLHVGPDMGFLAEIQFNDDSGNDVGFATGLNVSF